MLQFPSKRKTIHWRYEMMVDRESRIPTSIQNGKKNLTRRLAYLVDYKYGQIVQAPSILVK